MANAQENFEAFAAWADSKSDDDYRAIAYRGSLSRKEIAKECGFAKSALDQNPRVKTALQQLENSLRERKVLPPLASDDPDATVVPPVRAPSGLHASLDAERLRRLEDENALLKNENAELKRMLQHFKELREALSLSGRLPR
jgi:hypothetical protein